MGAQYRLLFSQPDHPLQQPMGQRLDEPHASLHEHMHGWESFLSHIKEREKEAGGTEKMHHAVHLKTVSFFMPLSHLHLYLVSGICQELTPLVHTDKPCVQCLVVARRWWLPWWMA